MADSEKKKLEREMVNFFFKYCDDYKKYYGKLDDDCNSETPDFIINGQGFEVTIVTSEIILKSIDAAIKFADSINEELQCFFHEKVKCSFINIDDAKTIYKKLDKEVIIKILKTIISGNMTILKSGHKIAKQKKSDYIDSYFDLVTVEFSEFNVCASQGFNSPNAIELVNKTISKKESIEKYSVEDVVLLIFTDGLFDFSPDWLDKNFGKIKYLQNSSISEIYLIGSRRFKETAIRKIK